MNLFIEGVNAAKLTSAHFYSWELGLKTGMYYLRTKAAADALSGLGVDLSKYKATEVTEARPSTPVSVNLSSSGTNHPGANPSFTESISASISSDVLAQAAKSVEADIVCSLDNPDDCIACGS